MDMKEEFLKLIISNPSLSIKELSELTGLSRSTVARYCKEVNYNPKRHEAWNKGLTKETNSSLQKLSATLKGISRKHSVETRKKISNSMKMSPIAGGLRKVSGTGKKYKYSLLNGEEIILRSDVVYAVAKLLDMEKINWNVPNPVTFIDKSGVTRQFQLDFYLPDYDVYIVARIEPTNKIRQSIMNVKKQHKLNIIVVDEMLYRRLKYNGMSKVLASYKLEE